VAFQFGATKKDEPSVNLAFSVKKDDKNEATTLGVSGTR
jgi:hypothetical protein